MYKGEEPALQDGEGGGELRKDREALFAQPEVERYHFQANYQYFLRVIYFYYY